MPKHKEGNETLQGLGTFAAAGMEIAIPVAIGALAGSYLDGKVGWSPWLTVLLTILGMAVGFINLWRLMVRANKGEQDDA